MSTTITRIFNKIMNCICRVIRTKHRPKLRDADLLLSGAKSMRFFQKVVTMKAMKLPVVSEPTVLVSRKL
jgi:hypothetical protein